MPRCWQWAPTRSTAQDYATTNAQQFMDLLSGANVPVVPPQG
jgi:hypothetical protein